MSTNQESPTPSRVLIARHNSGVGITLTVTSSSESVSVTTPSGSSEELRAIAVGARLRAEAGLEYAAILNAAADQMDADQAALPRDVSTEVAP